MGAPETTVPVRSAPHLSARDRCRPPTPHPCPPRTARRTPGRHRPASARTRIARDTHPLFLIVPTRQRGNEVKDAPASAFFRRHGMLSLHPRLPGRLPSARGSAAARLITACAAGDGVGELVMERHVWRQLVAALFGQHGDAGASQPRSHAGAWERSRPAMVVGAARVLNRRPGCSPVIGGPPSAGGCGR